MAATVKKLEQVLSSSSFFSAAAMDNSAKMLLLMGVLCVPDAICCQNHATKI